MRTVWSRDPLSANHSSHSPDVEGVSVVVLGAGGRIPGSGADTVISVRGAFDPQIRG